MWHPDIRLTRTFRLTFMIILIVSFFVISPILILYTAGYRFDLKTFQVKKTGVLTIDVEPNDARIFLNDIALTKSLPIRLPNRAPGSYALRIEKDGYLSWTNTVQVESTQTTYVTDLYLFLDILPTFEFDTSHATEVAYSPDGQFVAMSRVPDDTTNIYEVVLYSLSTEESTILWRNETSKAPVLMWSYHAPLLAVIADIPEATTTIEVVDARNPDATETYILATSSTPHIQWHEDGDPVLYVERDHVILALSNGTTSTKATVSSSLWFVDNSGDVWSIYDNTVFKNNTPVIARINADSITQIMDTRASHILVRTDQDISIVWLDSGNSTHIPATNIFPRTYGKNWSTWILWSEWEVSELLESGDVVLLTRTNRPLKGVSASTKHEALFFSFDHDVIAFHPHFRTSHTLFSGDAAIKNIATHEKGDYIIFETSINNNQGIYKRSL